MSIRPIGDRIAVRPVAAEETTKSGIVLPGSAQEKSHRQRSLAVGSGYVAQATGQRIPLEIKLAIKWYTESMPASRSNLTVKSWYC